MKTCTARLRKYTSVNLTLVQQEPSKAFCLNEIGNAHEAFAGHSFLEEAQPE